MCLSELRNFNTSIIRIKKNLDSIRDIYEVVGELDALQSIASYKEGLADDIITSKPIFIPNNEERSETPFLIKAEEVIHPLIKEPIPNSFTFSKNGIIITGSNMAGKSTFLRLVGVNALLSQTIYMVFAKEYKSIFLNIISSISQTDNLTEGKSFYLTESERLLKIINSTNDKNISDKDNITTLCLLDELLKGTNSYEREKASKAIMKYLLNRDTLSIIATHDIGLAKDLENKFECYYFVDNVDSENGLDFDYKMKDGISNTSNVIRLLEYLKYPKEIYEEAYK